MKLMICLLCAVSCASTVAEERGDNESKDALVEKEKAGIWVRVDGKRRWYTNEQIVVLAKYHLLIEKQAKDNVQKEETLRKRQQTITELKLKINSLRDSLLELQNELGKAQASHVMQMAKSERLTRELAKKNQIIAELQEKAAKSHGPPKEK